MGASYYVFRTELGWVGVAGVNGRVQRLTLPKSDKAEAEALLRGGMGEGVVETNHDFRSLADQLVAYFAGERVSFECEVDMDGASAFDGKVWQAVREIGYGEARSYGWVASRIGQPRAVRAVGRALSRNPIPVIIPCHRVIRSDGSLGGFSSGAEWKARLLGIEGRRIGD